MTMKQKLMVRYSFISTLLVAVALCLLGLSFDEVEASPPALPPSPAMDIRTRLQPYQMPGVELAQFDYDEDLGPDGEIDRSLANFDIASLPPNVGITWWEQGSIPLPTGASFPFYDGFESGTLGADWTTYTTNEGRVQVSASYPYSGGYSLLLDDSAGNSTYSYAAAILTIDLSGQSQVELDFWWREFSDEDHTDDGVFISDDDGANWHPVLSFNGGTSTWRQATIDIDAEAAANGLTLNDRFQIKFQFYDNYSISTDGYAIDEVRVQGESISLYLPIVLKNAGPLSSAPVLDAINNADGDGSYTVSWSAVSGATAYNLQEDDNASFTSPTTVYSGASTSETITGRAVGTYYYRVQATNSFGSSSWSNVVSVQVTTQPPPPPPGATVYIKNNCSCGLTITGMGSSIYVSAYSSWIGTRDSGTYYVTITGSCIYPAYRTWAIGDGFNSISLSC